MITKRKTDVKRILLIITATLMPFIVAYILVAATGHSLFSVIPYYSGGDAVARYEYIRNIIEHGHILGYNGYDFQLAHIASLGSAWGFFWSIPYLAWGKLFGWTLNSPILANISFLCLANLLFIYLTKASKRTICLVAVFSCLLFVNVDYSISSMSEPSRYAIAIILVGMLYRIACFETSKIFRYFIVPVFIVFGASTFILLSAFIIPYCLIVFTRIKKLPLRILVSVAIFLPTTIIIKKANSLFCTPYYEIFNIKKDLLAFKEGGVGAGIAATIKNAFHNFLKFTWGGYCHIDYHYGKFTWFVLLCWAMMIAIFVLLIGKNFDTKKDRLLALGALYILAIIAGGYIVLYNDVIPTLIRGIQTGLCSAVFIISLMESKYLSILFISLSLLWSPFFVMNFRNMCNEEYRCASKSQIVEIENRQAIVSKYIVCNPDSFNPWNNTVAIRYGGLSTSFVVPSGMGKISMHNVELNESARYVIVGNNASKQDVQDAINLHIKNHHKILCQTEDLTILELCN